MLIDEKIKAVELYIRQRESCLDGDRAPYKVTGREVVAFLNGWDAAIAWSVPTTEDPCR